MNSSRRAFLALGGLAGAGLLAGCIAPVARGGDEPDDGSGGEGDGLDGEPGDDASDAGGTRPAGTGGPGVGIVARDDQPPLPVGVSVEVADAVATAANPPRLRVTLTNTGDGAVTVGESRAAVFAYRTSTDGQLTLLPSTDEDSYPVEPDCWRLREPIAVTQEYRTVDLEPGESLSRVVSLYGAPGTDACLPVGEHRFETVVGVAPLGELPDEEQIVTWGFSVLLE